MGVKTRPGGRRLLGLGLAVIILSAACAPAGPSAPAERTATSSGQAPRSITMVFAVERPAALAKLNAGVRGNQRWWWIVNAYLTGLDRTETPQPMLAETIPSVERGTWVLNADGTMETTYQIRSVAQWHDGRPVAARDFAFAWEVYLDPEFPTSDRTVESLISEIRTPDDRTLVIRWKEPYIGADSIRAPSLEPLPTHLLEHMYRSDKPAFIDGKHWTSGFVGAGPFRVEEWVPGSSQFVVAAHDGYALGRPQIDRIYIRFIDDGNAVLAGILAGEIDVAFSDTVDSQAGVILRDQWESQQRGTVGIAQGTQRYMVFQFRDLPSAQPAVRDRQVRQALAHAIDRDGLAALQPAGFLRVAHYPIALSDRFYDAVDRTVLKYLHDLPRAERLLDDAGYRRGPDGVRRGPGGDQLTVTQYTSAGQESEAIATVIAEYWTQLGVDGSMLFIPAARVRDREYQATFPGALHKSWVTRFDQLLWTSDQTPNASNSWSGSNWGGYATPAADQVANRVLAALDVRERERLVVELMRIWTDDVAVLPLLYNPEFIIAAEGIGGYEVEISPTQAAHTWTIYEWTKE